MPALKPREKAVRAAEKIAAVLKREDVELTMGGEPTYVPFVPEGAEWNTTAVGPTKLRYAYRMADALVGDSMADALCFYSPGKSYPNEQNPRWTLQLVRRRDGRAMMETALQRLEIPGSPRVPASVVAKLQKDLSRRLGLRASWLEASDLNDAGAVVRVLPLDFAAKKWVSARWLPGRQKALTLSNAGGPAGLRLPLNVVPEGVSRRALVLEVSGDSVDVFVPPLLQRQFEALIRELSAALAALGLPFRLQGYVASDAADRWEKLSIAPDPGVLEINLPACFNWAEYDGWIDRLDRAAAWAGLCSYKTLSAEESCGTGGGNHLLLGGPDPERNAFFKKPGWVTSIIRYWQQHPSLSYLFTGQYVGASSQAPRPDESARALYDLEMAYRFLETLEPGDHRYLISETLRHLHTDGGGNTHRSEISFDKFWSTGWDGGCRGLIEFRAVETLPRTDWTSSVGLLWLALAAHLLVHPCTKRLKDYTGTLHDWFFLPAYLWEDLRVVLRDLARGGFDLPVETFREIWNWRFPRMLLFSEDGAELTVRKAHEGWPLLCETPIEGGATSRFVDTSIERLELLANGKFAQDCVVTVQGRPVGFHEFPGSQHGAGLRYRRTMLHPSLHPGMPPHMPLRLTIRRGAQRWDFRLAEGRRRFEPCEPDAFSRGRRKPCAKLAPSLLGYDLRIL